MEKFAIWLYDPRAEWISSAGLEIDVVNHAENNPNLIYFFAELV